jgi:hypothetical protein
LARTWNKVAKADDLKEQLRRAMGDLGAAESRAIKAERAVKGELPIVSEVHKASQSSASTLLSRFYEQSGRDSYSRDDAPATIGDIRALIFAIEH